MAVTIIVPIIVSVLSVIAAYLIGSINSSILISKAVSGKDIRESGSGNAGATNMLRTMGKKYAVITLVIDIIKGVAAVLLARAAVAFGAYEQCVYLAGVFRVQRRKGSRNGTGSPVYVELADGAHSACCRAYNNGGNEICLTGLDNSGGAFCGA